MDITKRDFDLAIRLANEAGLQGYVAEITYIPPTSVTQSGGCFVVQRFNRSLSGELTPA